MNNGTTKEVIEQFDEIAKLPDYWDHNQQYQNYLLKHIKGRRSKGLDIGCGTGELTRKLKQYCELVIGIDISSRMVEEAIARNRNNNIEFINSEVEEYLQETNLLFDVIISIATVHHLDMERALGLMKQKLNGNGILLILDLYRAETIYERLLSILAALCNPMMYLIKRGRLRNTKEEREVWNDHFRYDHYSSIEEIREISERVLGKVEIKRHLFWRYSLIYKREET
jgi:SAM-dependent methyltransferase